MSIKIERFLGILLSLALVLGLVPGMSLTAYADGTTYDPASTYTGFGDLITNDTEVTISEVSGKTWYVIAYDGSSTVTLLSKQSFANQAFNSDTSKGNNYETSDIKVFVDGLTGEGQPLAGISSVISDLTLIDKTTAKDLSVTKRKGAGVNWWLCSQGADTYRAAFVLGGSGDIPDYGTDVQGTWGVRPALKLDLSKVTFDSTSKTFSLKPPKPLDPVSYMVWDTDQKKLVLKTGDDACKNYTEVTDDTTSFANGWYVVSDTVTISNRITVTGTVHLILLDKKKLTINGGIHLISGNTLNIYVGSTGETVQGDGALLINEVGYENAGIGGNVIEAGGTVTIHGGKVTATGGGYGAGIGGGTLGAGGKVTINGGEVTVTGGYCGAGIGGGESGDGGTVIINGGEVTATGEEGGAGIGAGYGSGNNGSLDVDPNVGMLVSTDNKDWSAYDATTGTRTQYMKTGKLHTHNFTSYSASGDTITPECHGCELHRQRLYRSKPFR